MSEQQSETTRPDMSAARLLKELSPDSGPIDPAELYAAGKNASRDAASRLEVCGAMIWTGYAAPHASTAVYDAISAGVLGQSFDAPSLDVPSVPLPNSFWAALSRVLTGPEGGYNAGTITAAVASLGGAVHGGFRELAEAAACNHPGADGAQHKTVPGLLSMEDLARSPDGSLAHTLYRMLTDNGFDPEVLDRGAIGLANMSPALRYLNTRILQMHDVWHLVAGYETTSLHEIAISGFQLAQFGHNYSAMFLAMVTTRSHLSGGAGFDLLMRTICEAWQHGRQTPPLMAVEFEEEWHAPIDDVRRRFDIEPFSGSFPADLFEKLAATASSA